MKDLEIYRIATELSDHAWIIYESFNWQDKKILGDQFIRSMDSIRANIAEGFGRFHYLDKNKFNYNARGSLYESIQWLDLIYRRGKINKEAFDTIESKLKLLSVKLNNYISATRRQKEKES